MLCRSCSACHDDELGCTNDLDRDLSVSRVEISTSASPQREVFYIRYVFSAKFNQARRCKMCFLGFIPRDPDLVSCLGAALVLPLFMCEQNVVKILGLKFNHDYQDTKSLRYGHLMIMTDQDHDGSHILSLIHI